VEEGAAGCAFLQSEHPAPDPLCPFLPQHKFRLRGAKTFVIHPDYVQLPEDQPTGPHDLALILLNWPVDTSEFPLVRLPDGEAACAGGRGTA
jgi:hypothetical protein